jgi:hypothetical protein
VASSSPITKSFEAQNNLTVFTVVDAVNSEQVIAQVVPFLSGEPTQLVLWNCGAGSFALMATKDLQSIVDRGKPFADRRRGGRTAIVCVTDIDYGLCRIFRGYAHISRIPFEMNIFRHQNEAREWLKGCNDERRPSLS